MKLKRYLIKMFLLVSFGLFYLNGCCLIGLGIGAASDAQKPDSVSVSKDRLAMIKPGERIRLTLKDGSRVTGTLVAYRKLLHRSYLRQYYTFRNSLQDPYRLPYIYETLKIQTSTGRHYEGAFLGFDRQRMYVLNKELKTRRISLSNIKEVDGMGGKTIKMDSIDKLFSRADFPFYSEKVSYPEPTVTVAVQNGSQKFPLNKINEITILPRKNGKLTGFLVGAVLDLGFTVLIINSLSHSSLIGNIDLGPM